MSIRAGKATFWTALASGTGYLALMAFFHAASRTGVDQDSSAQNNLSFFPNIGGAIKGDIGHGGPIE